jgi:signal transduction histidine kinase
MALKINDNGVDREMTTDEEATIKAWQKTAQAEAQAQVEAQTVKAETRQAVLDKLGLTADEAAALLG